MPHAIVVFSRNGVFQGTFFLAEYMAACRDGNAAGLACVQEAGSRARITPGEAEERAGLGSNRR